jgi:hypothetical protein
MGRGDGELERDGAEVLGVEVYMPLQAHGGGGGELEVDNSRLTETIPRRWLPPPTPIHD